MNFSLGLFKIVLRADFRFLNFGEPVVNIGGGGGVVMLILRGSDGFGFRTHVVMLISNKTGL